MNRKVTEMKYTTKHAVIATCIGLAAVQAWADQTNLVRNLDINLLGVGQGGSTTIRNVTVTTVTRNRVGTADIINAIGTATGNGFSQSARLVSIVPLANGSPTIAIRDHGNSVDVSAFFNRTSVSDEVAKSTVNNRNGKANGSTYSLQQFALQNADGYPALALHYVVTGVAVEDFSIPAIPGPYLGLSAEVSGTGDSDGSLLIIQGSIRIFGQRVEVIPDDGGGPPT
jgi:hypothetical protein